MPAMWTARCAAGNASPLLLGELRPIGKVGQMPEWKVLLLSDDTEPLKLWAYGLA